MLISIIIPCHNFSATIHRAVDAVISQTYNNWELILVDNNSADDTLQLLKNIQTNNPEKTLQFYKKKRKAHQQLEMQDYISQKENGYSSWMRMMNCCQRR